MSPFYLLVVLSLVDSIFVGYRAAAGRNPALHKTDYYLKASWLGLALGFLPVVFLGSFLTIALSASADSSALVVQFEDVCWVLVRVYGIFATLVLGALLLWTYPHRKGREISVMLILGPFTLLRPWWIVLGVILGTFASPSALVASGVVLAGLSQLSVELLANWIQERAQVRRMGDWKKTATRTTD